MRFNSEKCASENVCNIFCAAYFEFDFFEHFFATLIIFMGVSPVNYLHRMRFCAIRCASGTSVNQRSICAGKSIQG